MDYWHLSDLSSYLQFHLPSWNIYSAQYPFPRDDIFCSTFPCLFAIIIIIITIIIIIIIITIIIIIDYCYSFERHLFNEFFFFLIQDIYYSNYKELITKKLITRF